MKDNSLFLAKLRTCILDKLKNLEYPRARPVKKQRFFKKTREFVFNNLDKSREASHRK